MYILLQILTTVIEYICYVSSYEPPADGAITVDFIQTVYSVSDKIQCLDTEVLQLKSIMNDCAIMTLKLI